MAVDLKSESRAFAQELSALLNATVCSGPQLNCLVFEDDGFTIVGYKLTRDNVRGEALPLRLNAPAKFYLGLSMRLRPDAENDHLMVHSSAMTLRTGPGTANAGMLLHYDYERDKPDDYPEAHLQVCATSDEWKQAGVRLNGDERLLTKLHLPVGGRRFRPTLEDIIEFLIVEKLVEARPEKQWKDAIAASRDRFREKQLRAAVRRYPAVALEQLRADGHI